MMILVMMLLNRQREMWSFQVGKTTCPKARWIREHKLFLRKASTRLPHFFDPKHFKYQKFFHNSFDGKIWSKWIKPFKADLTCLVYIFIQFTVEILVCMIQVLPQTSLVVLYIILYIYSINCLKSGHSLCSNISDSMKFKPGCADAPARTQNEWWGIAWNASEVGRGNHAGFQMPS